MSGRGGKRENSGRPKGRPNKDKREFQDLLTDKDVKDAVDVLKKCLKKEDNGKLQLDAAQYMLDQKYGKARQRNEVKIEGIELIISDFR